MKNPAEAFLFLSILIGGWALGWFSVARWLARHRKVSRFIAHAIGFVCGFFSAVAAAAAVGAVASPNGGLDDVFGPLLILGALVYLWRDGRAPTDTPPPASASVAPAQGVTLPCTFHFSYVDHHGNCAPRTVDVDFVSRNSDTGHTYLDGFCHDRMDNRTFRTDRIRGDLTDTATGELLPVSRLLSCVTTRSSMDYKSTAPGPQISASKEWQTAVFFAGFRGGKLEELEGLANAAGWQVRWTISRTVDYVVRNGSAGKKQLEEAGNLGISVIDEETFRLLV